MKNSLTLSVLSAFAVVTGLYALDFSEFSDLAFAERYAYSTNRTALIDEFKRDTAPWYFYTLLNLQTEGKIEEAEQLAKYGNRTGHEKAWNALMLREMFLRWTYSQGKASNGGRTPDEFLAWELERCGLKPPFCTREVATPPNTHPSALDQSAVSYKAYCDTYAQKGDYYVPRYDFLPPLRKQDDRRSSLTNMRRQPNEPGLVDALVRHFQRDGQGRYVSCDATALLTIAQLEELRRRGIVANDAFIGDMLKRLEPNADEDVETDPVAHRAWLDRIYAFAKTLPDDQKRHRISAMRGILEFERSRGNFSERGLFIDYLKQSVGKLPVRNRGTDNLVADYLSAFRKAGDDFSAFKDIVADDDLKRIAVETDLLSGKDQSKIDISSLSDDAFRSLRDRVEINWFAGNQKVFAGDDDVSLDVDVKNVKKLRVAIYELDPFRAMVKLGGEIKGDVDLDGCVPTEEKTLDFTSVPAIVRHRERLDLPSLKRPGVYVVECSGAGVSSRAMIRKGTLNVSERVESCGHVFAVADESGKTISGSQLRIGETMFASDDSGEITVPFTDEKTAGEQLAIVGAGRLAAPYRFKRRSESYELKMDAFLPPEAIVAGREATAVLSFRLSVAGSPASLSLIADPKLEMSFGDIRGVRSASTVGKLELKDNGECAVSFAVPDQVETVSFDFSGKVRNLSMNRDDDVRCSKVLRFNGICNGDTIEQAFLRHDASGYSIELRGRNGEPMVARELHVLFAHRVFRDERQVTLQTDANGIVKLGELADIDRIHLASPLDVSWNVAADSDVRLPESVSLKEGETLTLHVPSILGGGFPGAGDINAALTLVALNGKGAVTRDVTGSVSVNNDILTVGGLSSGDYNLYLRGVDRSVALHVAKRMMGAGNAVRPIVAKAEFDGDRRISVHIANATEDTRVHLVARHFTPDQSSNGVNGSLAAMLAGMRMPCTYGEPIFKREASSYISGRDLGDTLRYILDRRNLSHRPGNMLERPSLLLNPWSVGNTRTDEHVDRNGEDWAGMPETVSAPMRSSALSGRAFGDGRGGIVRNGTLSYDFLAENERTWCNRRPDGKGDVAFDLPEGLDLCDFTVVVTDGDAIDSRRLVAKSVPTKTRDLRSRHDAGGRDRTRSRTYADLKSAYDLIRANSHVEYIGDFGFVANWPSLSDDAKRDTYGKFACHELDVFLYFKDRHFFDTVVLGNLRNKRHKEFIDVWLTGGDLSAWTKPYARSSLNDFERCLLAKRVPAVAKEIAGQLRLWCEANPASPETLDRQLRSALGLSGNGMEAMTFGAVACEAPPELAPVELSSAIRNVEMIDGVTDKDAEFQMRKSKVGMKFANAAASGRRLGKAAERRSKVRQTYHPPETTREWVETQYYHRRQKADSGKLASCSRFWSDYAAAIADGRDAKFLPQSFSETIDSVSLAEAIIALAVIDLPFEAKKDGPKLVYAEPFAKGDDKGVRDLTVIQRFADPSLSDKGETHYVTNDLLVNHPYELVTVVSNPTDERLRVAISVRIPDGAIPLDGGQRSECSTRIVYPYGSVFESVSFYFPASGKDTGAIDPASVAVAGEMRGIAGPLACKVVDKPSSEDRSGWNWISQNGTEDEVIEFISSANLESANISLGKIGWRMYEADFAKRVYDTLSARGVFDEFLWRFSLFGRSRITDFKDRARELLMSATVRNSLAPKLGPSFHCPLIDIEPEETDLFEYSEFWPLINARAHALGGTATIANESLKSQYRKFLDYLATHRVLSARDRIDAAVYLIAQDRVDEAKRMVEGIRADDVDTRMQLDYLHAYFAFSDLKPEEGREIAKRYANWPVPRWRDRFRNVIAQADEIAGRASEYAVARSEAAEAPSIALSTDAERGAVRKVTVRSRNVAMCILRAYKTDVEITFSKSPFGNSAVKMSSALLKPAWETELKPDRDGTASVELPEGLLNANVMIEVTDAEERVSATQTILSGSLEVQVASEYGEVRVRDPNGKALPAAYVKVYAQDASGLHEKFHKDGYTDLRGVFDYASVSTDSEFRPARFAILVQHETEGVKILTVNAPGSLSR